MPALAIARVSQMGRTQRTPSITFSNRHGHEIKDRIEAVVEDPHPDVSDDDSDYSAASDDTDTSDDDDFDSDCDNRSSNASTTSGNVDDDIDTDDGDADPEEPRPPNKAGISLRGESNLLEYRGRETH